MPTARARNEYAVSGGGDALFHTQNEKSDAEKYLKNWEHEIENSAVEKENASFKNDENDENT